MSLHLLKMKDVITATLDDSRISSDFGKVILRKENRCWCVLHMWQIAVKAACEVIQNKTTIIRNVNIKLQSSKVQCAVF